MSRNSIISDIRGISNFRDAGLGNMRKGVLFRSATLDRATSADLEFLKNKLGIKSIIDLRGPKESLTLLPGTESIADSFKTIDFTKTDLDFTERSLYKINLAYAFRVAIWESISWMARFYFVILTIVGYGRYAQKHILANSSIGKEGLFGLNKAFLKYGADYWRQFVSIVKTDQAFPILIHCSAGKDRTGLSIALLQKLCGVDDDTIIDEYALSASLLDQELLLKNVVKMGLSPDFSLSEPVTMKKTLEFIKSEYGSVERYFLSIGIAKNDIKLIKRVLC